MSSRKFRLATVLRVRKIQEEQARGALAAARMEIVRAEEDADARAERASAKELPATSGAEVYLAAIHHRLALANDAAIARGMVAEVTAAAEEKNDEWRSAAAKVKPLEQLEETHRDNVRRHDERLGQAAQDEIAGARHESGKRSASRNGHDASAS